MKRIRYLKKKNSAVSAVIGTILIISIIMSSISFVMIFYIPQMERMKAFSRYDSVNTQFDVLENSLSDLISNGDGSTGENNVAIESGSFAMNNIDEDRLVVMYSDSSDYNFTVTGLGDGDNNFILDVINGQVTKVKVRSFETTSNYNQFTSSTVPPPSVGSSPYVTKSYDFSDSDNKAYNTDQGTSTPLDPYLDIGSFDLYETSEYDNIESYDSNRNLWEGDTTPPPYSKYANILYNFKIDETPSSIERINFSWVGYDTLSNDGYFGLYIYNNDSSSWVTLNKTLNSFTEKTLSFNVTSNDLGTDDFSSFINASGYMIFAASGAKGPDEPENNPPNTPNSPSPSDGATGQSINVDLRWEGGDDDPGDTVTYDVYFGTDPTPDIGEFEDTVSDTTYDPGSLSYSTHYYWQIIAEDNYGETNSGPVWDFTTQSPPNNPPNKPENPSPSNGSTDQSLFVDLSWSGGDPNPGDTVTYDVYFGTDPTPDIGEFEDTVSDTTYDPGDLSPNTQYYWQIIAEDNYGETNSGPVWDFTTMSLSKETLDGCQVACCFPAGTKISMADGSLKNIESVVVGDCVLSFDVENDRLTDSYVVDLITIVREGVYSINNGLVCPTDDHPFYVKKDDGSKGWAAINPDKSKVMYNDRDAVQLEVGDYLFTGDRWVEIESIVFCPGEIVTYTFTVDSVFHDYFANNFLVSNGGGCPILVAPFDDNGVIHDDNDLDFFDDNCISFNSGFYGTIPSYNSNCLDSPFYYYKTIFSLDQDTIQPDISYLGDSNYASDSHFTLYENYLDLKVFYNANDTVSPSTVLTNNPDKVTTENNSVNFSWQGSDDVTNSNDLLYKYRLDPYQTSWQPSSWTSSTSITYNDLSYRDYVFRVRALDEAKNVETFENIDINTYSFSIVEPTEVLDDSNSDLPITDTDDPVSLSVTRDICNFAHIELFDGSDIIGCVYVFDFIPISWEHSSSSGSYSVYMENDAIFSSSRDNVFVMTKKPDGIYTEGDSFIFHIVQTVVDSGSSISFSGTGSLSLLSTLVENRVLEDIDIGMLKVQNFGKFADVWDNYYSEVHGFRSSDDVTLFYPDPDNLVLVYSIIQLDMESG